MSSCLFHQRPLATGPSQEHPISWSGSCSGPRRGLPSPKCSWGGGRGRGSRPTLLLTEGRRRPVIHRGRSLRSGHQVHLEARVTRGRVKGALPSVAPLWGCRQGQDAARSSPPAQSVRKRSRSDCPLPPLPSPSPHGHGRLPGAQHLGELGHSHSCRRQRLVSAARGHSG